MFENIRKNKIKSWLIVAVFISVISVILYYVFYALDLGAFAIVFALGISIVTAWGSYYYSDKIVLKMSNARPATAGEYTKIQNILDGLVISAGMKTTPKLYIMDSPQKNAFATGRNPENAVICLTTALLNEMDYYELEGVIAHELAHIKNYDIRLAAVMSVMVGFVIMLSDFVVRIMFFSDSDNRGGNPILMIVGLVFLILSPILGTIMQLAVSRKREYLADATAIEFTRNPQGLISALEKLGSDKNPMKTASTSTSYMFIANPFKKGAKAKRKSSSLFSTHPSIEDRVEALRNIR